jgi:hypothetical protein
MENKPLLQEEENEEYDEDEKIFNFIYKIPTLQELSNYNNKARKLQYNIDNLVSDLNTLWTLVRNNKDEFLKDEKLEIPRNFSTEYYTITYQTGNTPIYKKCFIDIDRLKKYINKNTNYVLKEFNERSSTSVWDDKMCILFTKKCYEKECQKLQEEYDKSSIKFFKSKPDFGW